MTRYAIGLGSNVGDRQAHLVGAYRQIDGEDKRVSSLYETQPMGGPEQDPFLNAVLVIDSERDPAEMLDHLQHIERQHGRERSVRWGPRTLDLDLLTTDSDPVSTESLTVPHPRASEREFVLRPLAEVWPGAPIGARRTAEEALEDVSDQGVDWLTRDWIPPVSGRKAIALVAGQFVLFIAVAVAVAYEGTLPGGDVTFLRVLGAVLAIGGVMIAVDSSRRLGPAMTASPIPRKGGSLVDAGLYRFVRHPIYGGVILTLMGTAMFLDSMVGTVVSALLIPYFWMKSSYEERQLRIHFAGYRDYQQEVRRRLIPFVI